MRYAPDGTDFVITNGAEFFNRPLYCDHSAFRVDGGDKPEFSIYVPGRGGNLRFGIKTVGSVKWLNDAKQIIARYRPGSMLYEIRDPLLGDGELRLIVLPLAGVKGVIARAEFRGEPQNLTLVWAFGGANGMRGRRGGDIGCEREPVSAFFQLKPEQCRGNEFSVTKESFALHSRIGDLIGVASSHTIIEIGDATRWDSADQLLSSAEPQNSANSAHETELPVVVGRIAMSNRTPVFLALLQPVPDEQRPDADALPSLFSAAERYRDSVANRVLVETPDSFVNAGAAALGVAADAIWDERQQAFMHGAVAWRVRLLGWRGPYAGDALGWHERTAAHFIGFAKQQNTDPVPAEIPPADENANLARNETALHSNGDMTKSHYDMNLVAVDAFFRHLLWTGDLDFARTNWPVIERHLAWERRLFRREFSTEENGADSAQHRTSNEEQLPLYEAYAAIWASDNLNYNGGGTAHASAYNYWHNKMAARVATLLGKDATPYQREANLILRGMNSLLWLPGAGMFGEYKDYLGLQQVHPNAGLWTFYHTLDSEVPTSAQAWQMSRWVDENIARIPVARASQIRTPNSDLPSAISEFFVLPETSWMPYQWSLNNVVVAENLHTALGYWRANRGETAFALFKGTLLDTMFSGLCPGNVGAMMQQDVMRGESQRDFGDGIGVMSRALVEGLFGFRPDALADELKIVPGFPAGWNNAAIMHPDFSFSFRREGATETYAIESKFRMAMKLVMQIPALRERVESVTVNGAPATFKIVEGTFGIPRVQIESDASERWNVVVNWEGGPARQIVPNAPQRGGRNDEADSDAGRMVPPRHAGGYGKFETVDLTPIFNDRVTQIFSQDYRSPRSPFCSLAVPKQGIGGWADNRISFDVDDSGLRAAAARGGGKIVLPNGVPLATPTNQESSNVAFVSQWDNFPNEIQTPLTGKSSRAFLLMAGSTGPMQGRFDNGEVIVTYADGSTDRLVLRNPTNWWPIDQDYLMDDFGFRRDEPIPPRVDLKTGAIREPDVNSFKGSGGEIPGGAATELELPLDSSKELKSLTVRALANEVVIGLMAVTLER